MRFLIVDDSVTMRRILRLFLTDLSVGEIDEASDGAEAVAKTAASAYDLVLLDWNMPTLSGLDALKAIRARGDAVPVIMVTTEAEKKRVLEALQAGASNYVIKPFDKENLLAKIRQVVPKAGPA